MDIHSVINIAFWIAIVGLVGTYLWKKKSWEYFLKKRKVYTKYKDFSFKRPLSDEEFLKKKKAEKEQLNSILDKISRSGYEGLTPQEKEFLFRQSQSKS